MFNTGDRVRVIVPSSKVLRQGDVFTVADVDDDHMISLLGRPFTQKWFPYRFEKVKESEMSNYPTELQVRDRLKTETGREYVVTNVQSGLVTYAYIPVKYDYSSNKRVQLDTRNITDLRWVDTVERNGKTVWPEPKHKKGDHVLFDGKSFVVDRVYGDNSQYVTIQRSVHVDELDK